MRPREAMSERGPSVNISEAVVVLTMLMVLGVWLLWSFFDSWLPVLKDMR
jgi:hypothetical protein